VAGEAIEPVGVPASCPLRGETIVAIKRAKGKTKRRDRIIRKIPVLPKEATSSNFSFNLSLDAYSLERTALF
jgi:hypothetical protein